MLLQYSDDDDADEAAEGDIATSHLAEGADESVGAIPDAELAFIINKKTPKNLNIIYTQ